MKGVVFAPKFKGISANKNKSGFSIKTSVRFDPKYIMRRYGSVIFFIAVLLLGLTCGSIATKTINSDTLSKLDLLFTTNLPERLKNGAIGAFCASFASDFLFLLTAFLMGLSLWGIVFLPFVSFFKGFGIGVSAGYLFSAYGLKGVVFYLAILLPGIFLFSMTLVYQSASSYNIFKQLFMSLFSKNGYPFSAPLRIYLQKSLKYLLFTMFSSLIDMILWFVFAGLFNFK